MPLLEPGSPTVEPELVRIAAAVLGEERVAQLRDALLERADHLRTIATNVGERGDEGVAGAAPRPATRASLDVLRACRGRIEDFDASLRAFSWVEGDVEDAHAATGSGSLNGFAIAVKDIIDVSGMPTRCGSPLTPTEPVKRDASAVARIRRAGAAVVGKTQCTEWALNDPAPTRNPWDATCTPGGSSSGSAVAVATGMCTASIDTQTAGDVLRPAAYNGVVGFKPTFGRVPMDGTQPVAPSIDTIGVIACSVADAAAVIAAIAGGDDRPLPVRPPRPRIGLLNDAFFARTSKAVRNTLLDAFERFEDAGARVEEFGSPVDLATVHAAHRVIAFAECAAHHRARVSPRVGSYGSRARELIDLGLVTPAHAYLDAERVRSDATDELSGVFDAVDVLIMPVTPGPAPTRDTTGDSAFQIPWTLCGFPALALPAGADRGLPLGVQLVAAPRHDDDLLAHARWCEEVLDVHLVPTA